MRQKFSAHLNLSSGSLTKSKENLKAVLRRPVAGECLWYGKLFRSLKLLSIIVFCGQIFAESVDAIVALISFDQYDLRPLREVFLLPHISDRGDERLSRLLKFASDVTIFIRETHRTGRVYGEYYYPSVTRRGHGIIFQIEYYPEILNVECMTIFIRSLSQIDFGGQTRR